MESLEIIHKFYSSPLENFLNMVDIFMHSDRKWKDISSSLHIYIYIYIYISIIYIYMYIVKIFLIEYKFNLIE